MEQQQQSGSEKKPELLPYEPPAIVEELEFEGTALASCGTKAPCDPESVT